IELSKVDYIAKLIPGIPGKPVTIQDCLTEGHEFYSQELVDLYTKEEWVKKLLDTAMQLEGVARNAGIHAAAVIVADRELTHYTPIMRGSKSTVTSTIAQYEFPILESIGLLKVDFLGLSTLSVMREAARLIKERHGIEYTLENIPYEGEVAKEAFKLLSSGEVSGVFQVESQGMRRVLIDMKPSTFEHIVAMISLYRPGPLEYIPSFIRRMHGEEPVEYKHPLLEPILAETYGILVYQEQIIQALSNLAGYTPGEADLVRRAIGKKKASEIEKHKKIFVAGCEKNGIDPHVAAEIYADIEFFARYGFNKSHAADYAVITVQTAYLKAHYPVEYMAAQLLVERDKTEKVINFVSECRRMGIDVLPPDVNYSGLDFEIQQRPPDMPPQTQRDPSIGYRFPVPEGSAIRFGMAAVKNVGEGPVQVIINARKTGGPFKSLEDFCDRVDLRQVNKRALECLIKVGALDRFGKRSQLLAVLDQMVGASASVHDARDSGQLSIFDLMMGGSAPQASVSPIRLPDLEEVKGREKLQWEKELLGVYSISHPLQQMNIDFKRVTTCSCAELDETYDGKGVTLAGVITSIRTINTKKGDQMAFVQLEDLQGGCEVVFFPKAYAEYKDKLSVDAVVIVKGKAQTRENQTTLLADIVQTHVESYVGIGDEMPALQASLLTGAGPTINGIPLNDDGAGSFPGDDDWSGVVAAQGDIEEPAWMRDGSAPPPLGIEASVAAPVLAAAAPLDDIDAEDETATDAVTTFEVAANLVITHDAPVDGVLSAGATPPRETTNVGVAYAPEAPSPAAPPLVNGSHSALSAPAAAPAPAAEPPVRRKARRLIITFRRSGDLERDKYRLKSIYEMVCDPKGRDEFVIRLLDASNTVELAFPNDGCTISEKLTTELRTRFRVEYEIIG
ncbi:MAG TPA: DNA polymerase III subunit alpha, partial [Chloroflexi bacterium]|nr:DNA polymerase III subunit alpha [Chloroflexota bacterium]